MLVACTTLLQVKFLTYAAILTGNFFSYKIYASSIRLGYTQSKHTLVSPKAYVRWASLHGFGVVRASCEEANPREPVLRLSVISVLQGFSGH